MLTYLRTAIRSLAKSPGFTLVAVFTLALAIGANTAIFAIVNDVLLRPLVPGAPEPVVNVFHGQEKPNRVYRSFSWDELNLLREPNAAFREVAGLSFALAGVGEGNQVRRTFAFFATENLLDVMGATPLRGRFFSADESRAAANLPVVVASYTFWQRAGGRDDFVGSTVRVNDRPYTIIGVSPKGFTIGHALISPEIWLPFGMFDEFSIGVGNDQTRVQLSNPRNYQLNAVARLKSGFDAVSAQSMLPALAERLNALNVDAANEAHDLEIQTPSRFSISTEPSRDAGLGLFAGLLLGMASVVLLIACLNLANMLLARSTSRAREFAVRMALGASRAQIIRLLLTEGLLLALVGGTGGLLLSLWANDLMLSSLNQAFSSMSFSIIMEASPSPIVLIATFGFCLLSTLLFSLGPAIRASRLNLVEDLKSQGSEAPTAGRWNRFFAGRHCLVMSQIALSLVLIFAAGLFFRGALNAGGLDLGFDAQSGLLTEFDYSLTSLPAAEANQRLLSLRDRAAALPGIAAAALSTQAPYSNNTNSLRIMAANAPAANPADPDAPSPGFNALDNGISQGYFASLGVTLLRGREFTAIEVSDPQAPPVVIIDQRLAKSLFPDGDALGQRIRRTYALPDGTNPECEIVGICSSFRHEVFSSDVPHRIFYPFAAHPSPNTFLHLRDHHAGRDAALTMIPTARELIRSVDASAPVLLCLPMADYVEKNIGLWIVRLGAVLFGIFGAVALVLAVIGVYGVKAYTVARRTREIGVRMALGARPHDIFALVMGQGSKQTFVGLAVGLVLALGVGQLLAQMLFEVSPFDPIALVGAALLLSVATLLACFLPARRAAKVDPMTAMRSE